MRGKWRSELHLSSIISKNIFHQPNSLPLPTTICDSLQPCCVKIKIELKIASTMERHGKSIWSAKEISDRYLTSTPTKPYFFHILVIHDNWGRQIWKLKISAIARKNNKNLSDNEWNRYKVCRKSLLRIARFKIVLSDPKERKSIDLLISILGESEESK